MELFAYLLKVSTCSALFFAFYIVFLRKLTFFKINRFYLLISVVISFIIPTLQFTIEHETEAPIETVVNPIINEDEAIMDGATFQTPSSIKSQQITETVDYNWLMLLPYLYVCIASFFMILASWRLFQLLKHTSSPVKEINGLKLVAKERGFTNCSFFNYVFIDENSLSETELAILLAHEEVHARQYHSVDKLLMMVAKAVLWFNPIVYLYDKALEEAHEYEADETTSKNVGTECYANLLLMMAVSKNSNPLIHNFVKSPIKQRIKMLFNSKSKNMKKLAYLLAVPIGLGLIWGFTIDIVNVSRNTSQEKEFTLVIDAGHGGKNKGATVNGVSEKEIALAMSKKLKALAEEKGIKVVTTRSNDSDASLSERAKTEGSFLISLHVSNQPKGEDLNGIEMFISPVASNVKTEEEKIKMSRSRGMTYDLYNSMKNLKGIAVANKPKEVNLFLLKNSKLPAVILELGYLTNNNDFNYITNDQNQSELAKAIIDGVLNFKKGNKTDAKTGRYGAYLRESHTKQANLSVGDQITVKANKVEDLHDSKYPVIKTLKMETANNLGVKAISALPKPILKGSSFLKVNNHTKMIYVKDAIMELFHGKLEAAEVEMHNETNFITAKNARFTYANGDIVQSDQMTFDHIKGAITTNRPTGQVLPKSAAFNLLSKLIYTANDSTVVSKKDQTVKLFGNARLNIDQSILKGETIEVNNKSRMIVATGAVFIEGKSIIAADLIEYSLDDKRLKATKFLPAVLKN